LGKKKGYMQNPYKTKAQVALIFFKKKTPKPLRSKTPSKPFPPPPKILM
jgi:hypothetical protein